MKKSKLFEGWGWLFIIVVLFSSCTSGITGTFLDNQGQFMPVNDSLRALEKAGYIHIETAHAGNPLIQTVMLKYEPTFSQKLKIAKHDHTLTIAILLVIIALVIVIWAIIYSNGAGKFRGAITVAGCSAILLCCGAAGLINWAHMKEMSISKQAYDKMQADGTFDKWVDENADL